MERIERLIDDYNAGSLNIDEYLRRLIDLSKTLSDTEQQAAREGVSEEQLAIFDLLTQPDPVLADEEREVVKPGARALLEHLHEVIVQDWHRKAEVLSDADSTIRRMLDQTLLEPYTVDIFNTKVQLVYDHVLNAYGDNGNSVYDGHVGFVQPRTAPQPEYAGTIDVDRIADDVIERMRKDPQFAQQVPAQLVEST